MPYHPLTPGEKLAGSEFGELAGEGAAIPVPVALEAEAVAFRNALVESLVTSESFTVPGFGRFDTIGHERRTRSVVFRPDRSVKDSLAGRPPAPDAPRRSELWAFVLAETATQAVYIDRIGWFGQKRMPAFSAGGREIPETTTLYFRPHMGLVTAIRFPVPP